MEWKIPKDVIERIPPKVIVRMDRMRHKGGWKMVAGCVLEWVMIGFLFLITPQFAIGNVFDGWAWCVEVWYKQQGWMLCHLFVPPLLSIAISCVRGRPDLGSLVGVLVYWGCYGWLFDGSLCWGWWLIWLRMWLLGAFVLGWNVVVKCWPNGSLE